MNTTDLSETRPNTVHLGDFSGISNANGIRAEPNKGPILLVKMNVSIVRGARTCPKQTGDIRNRGQKWAGYMCLLPPGMVEPEDQHARK